MKILMWLFGVCFGVTLARGMKTELITTIILTLAVILYDIITDD